MESHVNVLLCQKAGSVDRHDIVHLFRLSHLSRTITSLRPPTWMQTCQRGDASCWSADDARRPSKSDSQRSLTSCLVQVEGMPRQLESGLAEIRLRRTLLQCHQRSSLAWKREQNLWMKQHLEVEA